MTPEEFKAFKQSYDNYPSQDNEGYVPNRDGFKAGFMEGVRWERDACAKIAEKMLVPEVGAIVAQAIRARGSEGK